MEKQCKICEKKLPKSRISSDYCLPCEEKLEEWVRLQKAAQGKTVKDTKEKLDKQGEEILKQAKENFKDLVKTGESLMQDISAAGEKFFQDLSKQLFEKTKKK